MRPRRRPVAQEVTQETLPSLGEALATVQSLGFLCFSDYSTTGFEVWSPGVKQPLKPRQTLHKQRREVLAMMQQCLAVVCPSPRLHRWSWATNGDGMEICLLCREIGA